MALHNLIFINANCSYFNKARELVVTTISKYFTVIHYLWEGSELWETEKWVKQSMESGSRIKKKNIAYEYN